MRIKETKPKSRSRFTESRAFTRKMVPKSRLSNFTKATLTTTTTSNMAMPIGLLLTLTRALSSVTTTTTILLGFRPKTRIEEVKMKSR